MFDAVWKWVPYVEIVVLLLISLALLVLSLALLVPLIDSFAAFLRSEAARAIFSRFTRERRVEFLPSPPLSVAEERAAERRRRIQTAFREAGISIPESFDLPPPGFLKYEFIEQPPISPQPPAPLVPEPGREFVNPYEAYGQMVRLVWQLSSDQFLLGERVVDAIVALRRSPVLSEPNDFKRLSTFPLVRLCGPSRALRNQGKFPWKVVIETDNPAPYQRELHPLSDWLGIGIDFAPYRRIHLFDECQMGFGLRGTVGGYLITNTARFQMTCSHALASTCGSALYRGDPAADGAQPDAALLNIQSPCFNRSHPTTACTWASSPTVNRCIQRKTPVIKIHPGLRRKKGFIRSTVHAFDVNGVLHRFPHLEILPKLIPVPLLWRFQSPFSKPGDSGSWIFESETGKWLGMIVGGDEIFRQSLAAEALPLVNFFSLTLNRDFPGQPVSTQRYDC